MDYQLVLSNLKIVELWFLVTVDNDVSCHMIWWWDFQRWSQGEKWFLTDQCSISSEKTKVTQFTRLLSLLYYICQIIAQIKCFL